MVKYFLIFIVSFLIIACSRYPADVEQALKLAGDNRTELEKVLEHYKERPEDKLKLQSAFFLIANMPYHYTVHDEGLEKFKTYLKKSLLQEGFLAKYERSFGPVNGKIKIEPDLNFITSEYLIRNIDFSFQIWKESPWGKYISFDDFCENILPYRLSNEPLEYWKEKYYAVLHPVIDSMKQSNPDEIAIKLLNHIKNQGWNYERKVNSRGFGATIFLEKKYGNCKELAEYVAYCLRSVGINAGIDRYIQSPDYYQTAHFWNYRKNISGETIHFDIYDSVNLVHGRRRARKLGKIYRQSYALQKESLPVKYKNKYIYPNGLRDILLRDVSHEYYPETQISISLAHPPCYYSKDFVYLCIFNNKEWKPIDWSVPKNGLAEFRHIEPEILYQLRMINENRDIALSNPFIFHDNNYLQYFDADTTCFQSMSLLRKFREKVEWPHWISRSINGKFQGANQPDFSDSVTLYTIQKSTDFHYVDIIPNHSGKFKYVRYLSSDGGYNNMAEVNFYSGGKRLKGIVIGTDGENDVFPNSSKYSVFDNDPLTFFDALEADGAWAGLELDKPYHMDSIRFLFRNDDNNIRPSDTYELFYQSNGQWLSAGRKTADATLLIYEKVPSNTLYWLHNHTRGIEERPFTYENGKQVWW